MSYGRILKGESREQTCPTKILEMADTGEADY